MNKNNTPPIKVDGKDSLDQSGYIYGKSVPSNNQNQFKHVQETTAKKELTPKTDQDATLSNDILNEKNKLASQRDPIIPLHDKEKRLRIFSNNFRAERLKRNFSVQQMADYIGLTNVYVGKLERADSVSCPSLPTLYKICDVFGVTPNEMLLEQNQRMVLSEDKTKPKANQLAAIASLCEGMEEDDLNIVIVLMKQLREKQTKQNREKASDTQKPFHYQ